MRLLMMILWTGAMLFAQEEPEAMDAPTGEMTPNLMQMMRQHGQAIQMTKDQRQTMNKWVKANWPKAGQIQKKIRMEKEKVRMMVMEGKKRKAIRKRIAEIAKMEMKLVDFRLDYREHLRKTLTGKQWRQLADIYKNRKQQVRERRNLKRNELKQKRMEVKQKRKAKRKRPGRNDN